MKHFAILLATIPTLCFSQITLVENDFANEGDTVRMSKATDMSIDFMTTGANQTWDYSTLVADSQELREFFDMGNASAFVNFMYGMFAPQSYQATYFLPNNDLPLDLVGAFLPIPITDVFQFTRKNNDSITSVGFAIGVDGNEVPFRSDTIETRYHYPLTYNDAYTSRGYTNMDLNPVFDAIWLQYRQRSSVVDGWGSITTPYGTFDAVRIKHTIDEIDSIRMDFFGTGTPMWFGIPVPTSNIYEWWTNGEKEPILRIETSDLFGNEVVSSIEYRDAYLGLASISEVELEVQVYPNPVNDVLHVKGDITDTKYSIIDLSGKIVMNGSMQHEISVAKLQSGSYQLIIEKNGISSQFSFIKK